VPIYLQEILSMNNEEIKATVKKDGLCVSYLILACSIFICFVVTYWLYTESDVAKLRDYRFGYNRLITFEQVEDAKKFRSETVNDIYDDEIDIIWLPFVQDLPEGSAKLEMYLGILAGEPEREASYAEIAAAIDSFPEEYTIKERTRYLTALSEISGVHEELLKKYGLLITPD